MVNMFKRLNNIRLTQYVQEQMQEAFFDQSSIYSETQDDYNFGWLQSFEEANEKAKAACEIAKSGGFVTNTWDKEYYLWEILIKELNANKEYSESNEAIHDGRVNAFEEWIGWDLEPPRVKKTIWFWL